MVTSSPTVQVLIDSADIKTEQRFADFRLLKILNDRAIRNGYNRALDFKALPIKRSEVYPVTPRIIQQGFMRCSIILNEDGHQAVLDIAIEDMEFLPSTSV